MYERLKMHRQTIKQLVLYFATLALAYLKGRLDYEDDLSLKQTKGNRSV